MENFKSYMLKILMEIFIYEIRIFGYFLLKINKNKLILKNNIFEKSL